MQNTYSNQTAKFIATLIQNFPIISSEIMQGFIEKPEKLQRILKDAFYWVLRIWKTIKLGTFTTVNDLKKAIEEKGYTIDGYMDYVFDNMTISEEKTDIDLIIVSVEELGFWKGETYENVCAKGLEFGLDFVSEETVAQTRLQYPSQGVEDLLFATKPLKYKEINLFLHIFEKESGGICNNRGIYATNGDRNYSMHPKSKLVFARCKYSNISELANF